MTFSGKGMSGIHTFAGGLESEYQRHMISARVPLEDGKGDKLGHNFEYPAVLFHVLYEHPPLSIKLSKLMNLCASPFNK